MWALRMTGALWMATLRSGLQYRANAALGLLFGLAYQVTGFVFVWIVLGRFEALGGWSLGEVTFLYGLRLLMHALNNLASGSLQLVERYVRMGEYDRFLLRPLPPLLQIIGQHAPASAFGDLVGGVALFGAAALLVPVAWGPAALAYLLLAIVGGALIEFALRLLAAALSFRLMTAEPVMFLLDEFFSNFGNYPLTIFGGALRFALTFVLPLAFMAYFPSVVLLGRTAELQVHPALAYAAPAVGVIWFAIALAAFQHEQRHYRGSGT